MPNQDDQQGSLPITEEERKNLIVSFENLREIIGEIAQRQAIETPNTVNTSRFIHIYLYLTYQMARDLEGKAQEFIKTMMRLDFEEANAKDTLKKFNAKE